MKSDRPLAVVFFRTEAGNEPVREWLKSLPRVQHAWPVGKPLVSPLGGGIWELRSRLPNRIARVLFIVTQDEIVVLHAFIKRTQKTPVQELDLARRRKRQYETL